MSFDSFSRGPSKEGGNESVQPLSGIEVEIVESITPEQKRMLALWHKANLSKEKDLIVATRSEDIIYFLQCVQQGYIHVGGKGLRVKGNENNRNYFFVTPNPESQDLKLNRPDLLVEGLPPTFAESIHTNRKYYKVGMIQAVRRNLIVPYVMDEEFEVVAYAIYDRYCLNPGGREYPATKIEVFYSKLAEELEEIREDCFDLKNQKPCLFALGKILEKRGVNMESTVSFLKSLGSRGSICLAFNNKLIEGYKSTADENSVDSADEFVIEVPDGKLPLDVILGLEALGDFEEAVLDKLGV